MARNDIRTFRVTLTTLGDYKPGDALYIQVGKETAAEGPHHQLHLLRNLSLVVAQTVEFDSGLSKRRVDHAMGWWFQSAGGTAIRKMVGTAAKTIDVLSSRPRGPGDPPAWDDE